MRKGKLGFGLWLYPYISLWTVLTGQVLPSIIILGLVIAFEQDEWAVKQCVQAAMISIYWSFYRVIYGFVTSLVSRIAWFGGTINAGLSVIDMLLYITLITLILLMGILKLSKGEDIGLPGKGLTDKAYGVVKANVPPQYAPPPYGQQPPPYGQQPPSYGQPSQFPQPPQYQKPPENPGQ